MLKTVLSALLLFFSIGGVASAADDGAFEVEAEGRYPMVAGVSFQRPGPALRLCQSRHGGQQTGKKEANESLSEEMEQPVSIEIDPDMDISKVYRLLREEKQKHFLQSTILGSKR